MTKEEIDLAVKMATKIKLDWRDSNTSYKYVPEELNLSTALLHVVAELEAVKKERDELRVVFDSANNRSIVLAKQAIKAESERDSLAELVRVKDETLNKVIEKAGLDDPNWDSLRPLAFASRLALIDNLALEALALTPSDFPASKTTEEAAYEASKKFSWDNSRVEKLIAALEWYADEGNYTHDKQGEQIATAWGNNTCGEKAREALAQYREGK